MPRAATPDWNPPYHILRFALVGVPVLIAFVIVVGRRRQWSRGQRVFVSLAAVVFVSVAGIAYGIVAAHRAHTRDRGGEIVRQLSHPPATRGATTQGTGQASTPEDGQP